MKFTENQTAKFLELYELEETLWRMDLKDYKNKEKRQQALKRIADGMDLPGFDENEVPKKFKSLGSTYNQVLHKIKPLKKSGSGMDYASSLSWIGIMKRIKDKAKPQNTQKSTIDEMVITLNENETEEQVEEADGSQNDYGGNCSLSTTSTQRSRKRKADIEKTVLMLDSIVDKCQQPSSDSLDYFGKYIVAEMRAFDEIARIRVQEEISKIIVEEKKKQLNQ